MSQYLQYLTIPYKHQGRDFDGADCFGLIRLFYENELGIKLPDFTEQYDEEWYGEHDYIAELYGQYGFVRCEAPRFGDLLFFMNTDSRVGHVGVVLDSSHFIHMTRGGCGINDYFAGLWHRQLEGIYRYQERA